MNREPRDADLAADCERLQNELKQVTRERDNWKVLAALGRDVPYLLSIAEMEQRLREETAPPCACEGKSLGSGFILLQTDDWCDGDLGFRHRPVYYYETSVIELAKQLRCNYQPVILLPGGKP